MWRKCRHAESVYVGSHHLAERVVDHAVPLQGILPFEPSRYDPDLEMSPAVARPGVADVQVAFILDLELERCECGSQTLFDGGDTIGVQVELSSTSSAMMA